jgi:hypothetical protein
MDKRLNFTLLPVNRNSYFVNTIDFLGKRRGNAELKAAVLNALLSIPFFPFVSDHFSLPLQPELDNNLHYCLFF